jgi:2-methylcitrate dehydratase PrpD
MRTPTTPDLAIDLAQFASALDVEQLGSDVVGAVKMNIGDTLSCGLAGSSAKGIAEVSGLVTEWGGATQADIFVLGGRVPAHHAAWVNSAMCHARDYDDTHDAAMLHAGVSSVPAAIAAAQLRGSVSGPELISAVAAGLEVTCRLGMAIKVDIVETGFIYSSLLGYFGATAAAGRAIGLTLDQMVNAFGIVYSSVAGNHQVTRDASVMKRMQPGLAAQAAVVAVQLAQRGIRGSQSVFEGVDGFFRVYLQNRVASAEIRADLGTRFELINLSYKPYPCCRDTHAAVDAILNLRSEAQRPADDIESIRVGLTAPGYQIVCVPEEVRRAPRTIVEAQFSIPYTVSAAWIDGALGIGHFTEEGLRRADVLDLASRVEPFVDEDIDRDWRRSVTPAKVIVRFRNGETREIRVDDMKGHPRNPMTSAELASKTKDCAAFAARPMPADTAGRLTSTVSQLESVRDVSTLVQLLAPVTEGARC